MSFKGRNKYMPLTDKSTTAWLQTVENFEPVAIKFLRHAMCLQSLASVCPHDTPPRIR